MSYFKTTAFTALILCFAAFLFTCNTAPEVKAGDTYPCEYEESQIYSVGYTVVVTPHTSNGPVPNGKPVCCDAIEFLEFTVYGVDLLDMFYINDELDIGTVPVYGGPSVTVRVSTTDGFKLDCDTNNLFSLVVTPFGQGPKIENIIIIDCRDDCILINDE